MMQNLRPLAVLEENMFSIPNTNVVCMWHTKTHAGYTLIHINKNLKIHMKIEGVRGSSHKNKTRTAFSCKNPQNN